MLRHPAFPNVPSGERVGQIDGRRFMESLSEHTLACMAKGRAGEPKHVVSLAKSILQVREIEQEVAK